MKTIIALMLAAAGCLCAADRPNVVLIFLDDAAYSDFHPFGNPPYPTPNVEKLAAEGVRYTRFHVPQAVCSASRASLLSGCYPHHTQLTGAIGPGKRGLDPKFPLISVTLKSHGYATAHFGKWHIGDVPETRPTARGFDEYAGLPVSNDMWRHNPVWKKRRRRSAALLGKRRDQDRRHHAGRPNAPHRLGYRGRCEIHPGKGRQAAVFPLRRPLHAACAALLPR